MGAWTGLRFGDLNTLQPEEIQGADITRHMDKTGGKVVVPINEVVRAILAKYADEGGMPPALSNQKMNDYLKEACRMVPSLRTEVPLVLTIGGERVRQKIAKCELVTTHTARRSFASNMYLKGVPARTIMAITGHKTEQAFLSYIRLSPEEHANILRQYVEPEVKLKKVI
ncbi:MAG: tyrosine-type recombinase/integrase [Flavobacteriales bacterium]